MRKAQKRDALKTEKFWFRKDITTTVSPPQATSQCPSGLCDNYSLMIFFS